jgi:hypothetical protein
MLLGRVAVWDLLLRRGAPCTLPPVSPSEAQQNSRRKRDVIEQQYNGNRSVHAEMLNEYCQIKNFLNINT